MATTSYKIEPPRFIFARAGNLRSVVVNGNVYGYMPPLRIGSGPDWTLVVPDGTTRPCDSAEDCLVAIMEFELNAAR